MVWDGWKIAQKSVDNKQFETILYRQSFVTLLLRVKTVFLAQTWISLTIIVFIL